MNKDRESFETEVIKLAGWLNDRDLLDNPETEITVTLEALHDLFLAWQAARAQDKAEINQLRTFLSKVSAIDPESFTDCAAVKFEAHVLIGERENKGAER